MLKIRLSRTGKRNHATYRIVVAEHSRQTKGKPVEILGSYDPHANTILLRDDRVKYWIQQGAQPSTTVHNILVSKNILKEPKRPAWKSKKGSSAPAKEEESKQDTPAAS